VHFCEHTGVGSWLIVFVHTPLAHSVLMSLTVVHDDPKPRPSFEPEPDPDPFASTDGVLLLLQATDNAIAKRKAFPISKSYQFERYAKNALVTVVLRRA
jgi:hypothetical protein